MTIEDSMHLLVTLFFGFFLIYYIVFFTLLIYTIIIEEWCCTNHIPQWRTRVTTYWTQRYQRLSATEPES